MGSGHILVYAFDVLIQIYEAAGYSDREAAQSILKYNLYGIDIDKRAYQLASFALFMKARQYNRRILTKNLELHLAVIEESNGLQRWDELSGTDLVGGKQLDFDSQYVETANYLIDVFQYAKEYGSILKIESRDYDGLLNYIERLQREGADGNLLFDGWIREMSERLPGLVKQAKLLASQYDVVVTNPPYMGNKSMNYKLSNYVKYIYPKSKLDLFSILIEASRNMTKICGMYSLVTMQTWMFNSSFLALRTDLLKDNLVNLLHLGSHAFSNDVGTIVQNVAFVFKKYEYNISQSVYVRLVDFSSSEEKEKNIHNEKYTYIKSAKKFLCIPGKPMAYWISKHLLEIFHKGDNLSSFADARSGLQTSDNDRFLRLWFEVDFSKIGLNSQNDIIAVNSRKKWFPHTKGGPYRKWYGNLLYVVNWENNGNEIKKYATDLYKSYTRIVKNIEYYFKDGVTWSHTATKNHFAVRYVPKGVIFNVEAPTLFNCKDMTFLMGLLNSKIASIILPVMNQNMHFLAGDTAKFPVIYKQDKSNEIKTHVIECVTMAKQDWNNFEISMEFTRNLLIQRVRLISEAVKNVQDNYTIVFNKMKREQEKLNEIFINIYDMNCEISWQETSDDITLGDYSRTNLVKGFISYSVGCMMGRYSLDSDGLIYTGGHWNEEKYKKFTPCQDGIIPICDDEYFQYDIVKVFIEFVRVVYGKDSLQDNLKYIANSIGGDGSYYEVIRNYFLNNFFSDHCNTYQLKMAGKRPIYWLFDAGKKNSFKALVYLHRYRPDTIARLRTDYVHEQQERYHTAIAQLEAAIDKAASTAESVRLKKKLKKFTEQAAELHDYEEKVHHLADQMISIDLDDGVKKNYAIFQDILAKIK